MSAAQVLAALAAVAIAAFVVWRRSRIGLERKVGLLLLAVVLGVYASSVFPDLPDAKTVIVDVAEALGPYTYLLVGALAFLETGAFVGLVAPGETVVIAAGVIAGQGEIDLLPLIGVVWTCAVLGDTTSFFIGRRLGREFLLRHGPKVGITKDRLEQVERYFRRYGGRTILIGRFIGLVRALAPFIAGSSRLEYRRFLPYSVVGCGLWATLFCLLGYLFWQSFDKVAHAAGQATFAFGVLAAVVFGAVQLFRVLRDEEQRKRLEAWIDRQSRKPALKPLFVVARPLWRGLLRPAWRVLAPEVRFLWRRITPGQLGLELTTLLAIGGAATFTFVLYAHAVYEHPGPLGLDTAVSDVVDTWRPDVAVDIARVVTDLGALTIVGTLVLVTSFALALRRRAIEPIVLVSGLVLIVIAVQLFKAGIDRPRPIGELDQNEGGSFPSGHAAYATAWAAVAVALTRVIPGLASRAGLVVLGLVICAGVAASRVYLGAHYASDVLGGLGLGFAIYAICATVGLIVAFIRHNGMSTEGASSRPAPAADRR